MTTSVTYETNYISLLHESTVSSALNCFYVFYCNLKEKDIRRNKNDKKEKYLCEISIIIILVS